MYMHLLVIDKFEFRCCAFDEKLVIGWKFLTVLSVALDDETVLNLLSGCLALETLELFSLRVSVGCIEIMKLSVVNTFRTLSLDNSDSC